MVDHGGEHRHVVEDDMMNEVETVCGHLCLGNTVGVPVIGEKKIGSCMEAASNLVTSAENQVKWTLWLLVLRIKLGIMLFKLYTT